MRALILYVILSRACFSGGAVLGRRVFADGLGFGTVLEFQKKRLIGSSAHLLKLENHKIVEVKLQVRAHI